MAKLTGQWKRTAKGKLILCRRRFWFFFMKFESFQNHTNRLHGKLNKQAAAMQKTYDALLALKKTGSQIHRDIDESRESDQDVTPPAIHEFPLFKWSIADVPTPPDEWSHFEKALRMEGDMNALPLIKGLKVEGMRADEGAKDWQDNYKQESVGATSTPIPAYGNKGKGNQKQRNN